MDTNALILEIVKSAITGISAAAGTYFMIRYSERKKSDNVTTTSPNNKGVVQSNVKSGGGDVAGGNITK